MPGTGDISYTIMFAKAAEKFFKEHEDVRQKFIAAIEALLAAEHPEQVDVKKINGKRNDYFRIRLGVNRVVYTVINGKVVVIMVIAAGSRGDIYKKLKGR